VSLLPRIFRGTWRDLATGVNPEYDAPLNADGATDAAGTPPEPVYTRIEGGSAAVLPWWDGLEDPAAQTGLYASPDPAPWVLHQDAGGLPVSGAYDGAYRTQGPASPHWGMNESGGLTGDQATARIMRFPANIPDRSDPNGVVNADWLDLMAADIAHNGQGQVSEGEYTTELIMLPNVG
jgi:hypothetical protein